MSLSIIADGRGGFRLERDGRQTGWVEGRAIGFRGFESAKDARQTGQRDQRRAGDRRGAGAASRGEAFGSRRPAPSWLTQILGTNCNPREAVGG